MKAIARALVYAGLFILLTALPAAAQEKQSQDADTLRAKIEQFEKTDISSKSSSVRSIYQRTLLRLYNDFHLALQQDITELKTMQMVVNGTNASSPNEITTQIKKLLQERDETTEKMQTLRGDLQLTASTESPVPQRASREVEPQATNVSYTPVDNNARPAAMSIPVSDTLTANDSARSLPGIPKPASVYKGTIPEICEVKRSVEEANAKETDATKREEIPMKIRLICPNSGLTGLLLGGVVISQQEKNFSQSDPFFGFTAGYNTDPGFAGFVLHSRVQGIFQVQAQKAAAPPATASASPAPAPTPTPVDPSNFTTFLASRKTFDLNFQMWADRPFGRGVLRMGPYFSIGASTFLDKNELKGDETVTKEDSAGGTGVKLDPTLGQASNDLKKYIEAGLITNLLKDNGELFMQTHMLYGKYEALEGLAPGHDTRNRFIGRLRIFPTGLKLSIADPNDASESPLDMSPMFGVEVNAGRGPDQIKFFTGIAISIKRFSPFKPKTATTTTTPPAPAAPAGGNGSSFQ